MKKLFLLFSLSTILMISWSLVMRAQVPANLNYQAIARDSNGTPLANTALRVFLAFTRDSAGGVIEYKEQQTVTTNAFGLFTAVVGKGTPVTHTYNNINWADGHNRYMNVSMQLSPYSNPVINMGSTQLISVPYALVANKVANGGAFWKMDSVNNISNTNTGSVGINGLLPYSRVSLVDSSAQIGLNILYKNQSTLRQGRGINILTNDVGLGVTSTGYSAGIVTSGQTGLISTAPARGGYGVVAIANRVTSTAGFFNADSGTALYTGNGTVGINGLLPNTRMTLVDSSAQMGLNILYKNQSTLRQGRGINILTNDVGLGVTSTGYSAGIVTSGQTGLISTAPARDGYGVVAIANRVTSTAGFFNADSGTALYTGNGNVGINGLLPNNRMTLIDSTSYNGLNILHKESSGNGAGIYVSAPDNSYGIFTRSKNGTGVYASGATAFRASSFSKNGYGILAATYRSGGVAGYFSSDSGLALQTANGNIAINGVVGNNRMSLVDSTNYNGVYILHKESSGNGAGVYVYAPDNSYGVFARSNNGTGVYASGATAFRASSFSKNGYGILATTYRSGGSAGYFSSDSGNAIVTGTGKVGIGTSTPIEQLEVVGAIKLGNTSNANTGTMRWDGTNFQGYNGSTWINFGGSGGGGGSQTLSISNDTLLSISSGNSVNIGHKFWNNIAGASRNDAYFTGSGSVGIGWNSPAQKLDVNGAIKIGTTSINLAGSIRWDGTNFQGYNGSSWVNFGGGGSSQWTSNGNDIYNNNTGGVAIGNVSAAGNYKLRIRSTAGAFKSAMMVSHTNSYGYGILVYDSSGSGSGGVQAITTSGNAFNGQSTSGYGVYANTTTGAAVYGFVGGIGTGYGGYFDGGSYGYALRTGTGNVGIGVAYPTHKLEVNGSGYFTGTVTASCGTLSCSDIRYKKNIRPLTNVLDKVMQMKGVTYYFRTSEFKDKGFTDKKQIGVIAQELEKIYPELVDTDDKGFKSVDYAKITPILIEAIKELKTKCDNLQQNNEGYITSIDTMQKDIAALKTMMTQLTTPAQSATTVSK